jgi:metal-sulfur cluster biosynthetic enzyme
MSRQQTGGRAGQIWPYLREVELPEFDRDPVSEGLIRDIEENDGAVTVVLDSERCGEDTMIDLANEVRDETGDIRWLRKIKVTQSARKQKSKNEQDTSRPMTPLQAQVMDEEGEVPEQDPLGKHMSRPDVAPGAGYDDQGPEPLEGPGGVSNEDALNPNYEGELDVFQWEVDPTDESRPTGEAEITDEDWEYRVWWQQHPSKLVYGSIRALSKDRQDRDGEARPHAVGRAVVVNIVYDIDREGVVAIYGSTRDFRPFVDVFERAYFEEGDMSVETGD